MRYEVEVRVRTVSASGHAVQETGLGDAYDFGDNPRWVEAGAASAVKQTAARLVAKLCSEAQGDDQQEVELCPASGTPRRLP